MGRLKDFLWPPLARESEFPPPIDGTNISLWPDISAFWSETYGTSATYISPATADKVWAANRCIQLNSQQIASMPLRFQGSYEPAWVSNPDPVWYPNGISDAVFAAVRSMYGWGFAILYITSRYASGLPQTWTVVDPDTVTIEARNGRREYKVNAQQLDRLDVVQIDRNPGFALHGTSAISAYATQAWGLMAAGELGRSVMQGGIPQSVLRSELKINKEQAEALQAQWVARTSSRAGAPPVLGPGISFDTLQFSPKDLLLLEGQGFNARVIASAYGVPPFLLGLPLEGGLTYQNPEKLGEFWWRFELRPTAKRVADALTAQMLPRGNWVTFDASDTFSPIEPQVASEEDDPQLSQVADASPAQQNGAVRPIRPMEVTVQ